MSALYALSRLDQSKSEIRLLWIPPANSDSDSDSDSDHKVITTTLKDAPLFNALSYCWGGQVPDQPISVSGCQTFITESLATALRHLRPDNDGFYLWADAICINQEDLREKTWQVQLMRDIYSAATRVIIWLGPSTSEIDSAFAGIKDLGHILASTRLWQAALHMQKNFVSWLCGRISEPRLGETRDLILEIMAQHLDAIRHARTPFGWVTDDLYNREWFSRVWCIQECTNARMAVFRCGDAEVDFTTMATVSVYMRMFGLYVTGALHNRISVQDDLNILAPVFRGPIPITIIGFRMKRLVSSGHNLRLMLDNINVRNLPQEDVMAATQDIDRVYALLGVANDDVINEIVPDYSLSCAQAYTITARALLKHGHDDILSLCRPPRRTPGLPSWVPDWAAPMRTPWSVFDRTVRSFSACGRYDGDSPRISIDSVHDNPSLVLRGVIFDTIIDVGHVFSLGVDDISTKSFWTGLRPYFHDLAAYLSRSRYTGQQREQAAWRIPVGDCHSDDITSDYVRAPDNSHMRLGLEAARLEYGWEGINPVAALATDDDRPYANFIDRFKRMYDSRPLLSQAGYVGLCPKESQLGDAIAIFMGARVPYVVRPAKAGETWTLVGEAFVYGVMDGEFMDEDITIGEIRLE